MISSVALFAVSSGARSYREIHFYRGDRGARLEKCIFATDKKSDGHRWECNLYRLLSVSIGLSSVAKNLLRVLLCDLSDLRGKINPS
jgi:hypothetical protein